MAVIDTSMNLPKSCDICPNYQGENSYCLKGCFIPYRIFDMGDVRHKDCPIKSIEDLKLKLDKAHDDGFKQGYMQAESDFKEGTNHDNS